MYINYGDYEEYEDYDEQVRDLKIRQFLREGFACMKGFQFWVEKKMQESGINVADVSSDNQPFSSRLHSCGSSTCYEAPTPFPWVRHPTKKRTAGWNGYYGVPDHDQDSDRTNKYQKLIKGKNVVDVTDDGEPFTAREQHKCSSSEKKWSSDSSVLTELSVGRSSSTCYEASVPLPNWGHHTSITTTKGTRFMETKNRTMAMGHEQPRKKRKYIQVKEGKKDKQRKEGRKKKKRKMGGKPQSNPLPPLGGIPMNLQLAITKVGGTTPVWFTEKRKLTITDTNPKQGRLFIPSCGNVLLEEYLTAEEKEKLLNPTDESNGLKVMVVDTSGERFDIDLRYWESLDQYVFARNWNKMVKQLKMEPESDTIQIWCFRIPAERGSQLCFATNIERGHSNTVSVSFY